MRTARLLPSLPLALLVTLFQGGLLAADVPPAEDLQSEAKDLNSGYVSDLAKLAAWCEEQGLTAQAKKTRGALGPCDPYKLFLPVLPSKVGPPKLPDGTAAPLVEWHARFLKLRQAHAQALFDLARRAIRKRQPSLAYQLVLQAVHADPDHEAARRVLGYQPLDGQWHTPYEAKKLAAGMVWHEKFGWLKHADVQRYEKGERRIGSRWLTAEADAKQHRDIRTPWSIETEHYRIRTNEGLEEGVALGVKLETLHRLWKQVFVCYGTTEAAVEALFAGRAQDRSSELRRFEVVYYRSREEYVRSLKADDPMVEKTDGYYSAQKRTAYFYAGNEDGDRILYHEATHQLFQQSRGVPPDVGRRANYWIVEGIAMFMESLRQEGSYYVLGGLAEPRMNSARYHVFQQQFYVPFEKLTALGMDRLQNQPKLAKLYSQMAAQTSFLVFYDRGRYRDALVSYVDAVYRGNDKPGLLADLTGAGYAELDKQYQEYMKIGMKQE